MLLLQPGEVNVVQVQHVLAELDQVLLQADDSLHLAEFSRAQWFTGQELTEVRSLIIITGCNLPAACGSGGGGGRGGGGGGGGGGDSGWC